MSFRFTLFLLQRTEVLHVCFKHFVVHVARLVDLGLEVIRSVHQVLEKEELVKRNAFIFSDLRNDLFNFTKQLLRSAAGGETRDQRSQEVLNRNGVLLIWLISGELVMEQVLSDLFLQRDHIFKGDKFSVSSYRCH